jgi:hypothetical protein
LGTQVTYPLPIRCSSSGQAESEDSGGPHKTILSIIPLASRASNTRIIIGTPQIGVNALQAIPDLLATGSLAVRSAASTIATNFSGFLLGILASDTIFFTKTINHKVFPKIR